MKRLLLVSCLLLSGCGQKGPLYFPQDNDAAATLSPTVVTPFVSSSATSNA